MLPLCISRCIYSCLYVLVSNIKLNILHQPIFYCACRTSQRGVPLQSTDKCILKFSTKVKSFQLLLIVVYSYGLTKYSSMQATSGIFLTLVPLMCPQRYYICAFRKNIFHSLSCANLYYNQTQAIVLFQTPMAALSSSIQTPNATTSQLFCINREHLSIQSGESKVQQQCSICRYEQPFIQKTCLQSALSANHTQAVTFSARYGI